MCSATSTQLRGKRVIKASTVPIRSALPASSPKVLLSRIRLPISVRFQVGAYSIKTKREPHPVQVGVAKSLWKKDAGECVLLRVLITVNGKRDSGFALRMSAPMVDSKAGEVYYVTNQQNNCGSLVTVDPKIWDVKRQAIIGASKEVVAFNRELDRTKERIVAVFNGQVERFTLGYGPAPTVESVKQEFVTDQVLFTQQGKMVLEQRSAVGSFDAYYKHCIAMTLADMGLSEKSLGKRLWARSTLVQFLAYEKTPNLDVKQINIAWAKRFYMWLLQDGRMKPVSAHIVVSTVKLMLDYLVEMELLQSNPLLGLKLSKGKKKPVFWLEQAHIDKLWGLKETGRLGSTIFWFKVIVLTGMDYPDAVRYVNNRREYEQLGIGGKKIVIGRGKNESECHIPYSEKLDTLLSGPPPKHYVHDSVNQDLKIVAEKIGFPNNLTCKVGRKTAGAMWLLEGYTIHEISRFLGHSSIAMTESHYVKTSGITADRGMQRIKQNKESQSPFRIAS